MFRKVFVIGIAKDELYFALIRTFRNGKILKSEIQKYNMASIREIIESACKKYKFNKVRLLFSNDLSYILEIELPSFLETDQFYDYLKDKITTEIPEDFQGLDWDYKVIEDRNRKINKEFNKKAVIFAPVNDIFKRVKEVLLDLNVKIEAVEAESFSLKRSSNPLVGLAIKKDISGKNEDVLNITPKARDIYNNQSFRKKSGFILIFVFVIIISLTVVFFIKSENLVNMVMWNKKGEIPVTMDERKIEPSVTPHLVFSDYRLIIYYRLEKKSMAEDIKDILGHEGFSDIKMLEVLPDGSNQEESDQDFNEQNTLEIKVKNDISEGILRNIERALNSDYKLKILEINLNSDDLYDIEIDIR